MESPVSLLRLLAHLCKTSQRCMKRHISGMSTPLQLNTALLYAGTDSREAIPAPKMSLAPLVRILMPQYRGSHWINLRAVSVSALQDFLHIFTPNVV